MFIVPLDKIDMKWYNYKLQYNAKYALKKGAVFDAKFKIYKFLSKRSQEIYKKRRGHDDVADGHINYIEWSDKINGQRK